MKPSIWYIVIGIIIGFGVGVGLFLNMSGITEITTQAAPLSIDVFPITIYHILGFMTRTHLLVI